MTFDRTIRSMTPDERERFEEAAGKYEFSAGMTREHSEYLAINDILENRIDFDAVTPQTMLEKAR